jgi:hypothetical protein
VTCEDALLEQIADALGVLLEQPHRLAGLDILRQEQDADVGVVGADPLRGHQALVDVRRWHADVDRGIGLFEQVIAEQALGARERGARPS